MYCIKQSMVNRLHLSSAFLTKCPLKTLYNIALYSPIHAHVHIPSAESTTQGEVSCSGTPRHSGLGGAGDRTSNLPVTGQTALPHATLQSVFVDCSFKIRRVTLPELPYSSQTWFPLPVDCDPFRVLCPPALSTLCWCW